MRFHFCAAFYVLIFMKFYDFTPVKSAIIYIIISLVISLEYVNSAIENMVDMTCSGYNKFAKNAKDCSAAAVLISAILSVIVGIKFFWDTSVFNRIYEFFCNNILMLILLILSVVIWFLLIFAPKGKIKERHKI